MKTSPATGPEQRVQGTQQKVRAQPGNWPPGLQQAATNAGQPPGLQGPGGDVLEPRAEGVEPEKGITVTVILC